MQDNISVIIPVLNASTTVRISLDSLKKQNVRVREIILIDNASTDDSVSIIEDYKRKNRHLNIVLIKRNKTGSVASSLNMAIKKSRGNLIISMHSDSSLPANNEITKLTMPFVNDKSVVASYSYVLHPERIWKTYNFWEKCQSARVMGKTIPGLNAKFDCYKKEALLEVGGFDEINFDKFGDGSDADMYFRLRKIGKVILSNAQVVHLHYLSDNYSLLDWIRKRKNMSITSARLMRMYLLNTDIKGIFSFLTRPILSILPFIPGLKLVGVIMLLLFSFSYTPIMFIHKSTRTDPRIIILPLVNIFLIYFEAFWFLFTLATHKAKRRGI